MNEEEFLQKWEQEKSMYKAWGDFVTSKICEKIISSGRHLDKFLKQKPTPRLKNNNSLVDKAFYRKKAYDNAYEEIEDKVGCRFIVLLIEHIDEMAQMVKDEDSWSYEECRNFNEERKQAPLTFTYQSLHFVVKARDDFDFNGVKVLAGTPCEVQIRTLLQHAYAELTHSAVYKSKTIVEPEVHRTVARSMALIETTDDLFTSVNSSLNSNSYEKLNFQADLDILYKEYIQTDSSEAQKSSTAILDAFEGFIDESTIDIVRDYITKKSYLSNVIKAGVLKYPFYQQSIVLFVYYLIDKKRNTLINEWPLKRKVIEILAVDLGKSLD